LTSVCNLVKSGATKMSGCSGWQSGVCIQSRS